MDWIEIIKTVGVPVALLIFFIIKDSKRDKSDAKEKEQLTSEIKEVRDYQVNKLAGLVLDTKEAIMINTESSNKQTEATLAFHRDLSNRPCLKDHV